MRVISRLTALVGGALIAVLLGASPTPAAATLIVMAGGGGAAAEEGGGGDGYTWAEAVGANRCSVSPPDEPNITNGEQTVTTGNHGTYTDDSGKRLFFSAGTYSGVTISGDDMEIVLRDGADLGWYVITGDRIKVYSENDRLGLAERVEASGVNDLQLIGMTYDAEFAAFNLTSINGLFVASNDATATTYAVLAPGMTHAVFGNNKLRSTDDQSGARWWTGRAVIADNNVIVDHGGQTLRVHTTESLQNDCVDVVRNQINSGGGAASLAPRGNPMDTPMPSLQAYWEDNVHCDGAQMITGAADDHFEDVSLINNTFHDEEAPDGVDPSYFGMGWVTSPNTETGAACPTWSFQ